MVDPIRLELIKNALVMVSDNMMVSVLRTARSTLVKSNMDFSASILDAAGDMVAQGLALPGHLGATMPALRGCLDYYGDDIEAGDILASNDPYAGASHLNDIFMFRPVYKDGERICILGLICTIRTSGAASQADRRPIATRFTRKAYVFRRLRFT